MKKYKWYSLPALPTLLIVTAAAALLIYTLHGGAHDALAYFSYLLSTYALIIGVSGFARLFRAAGTILRSSRLVRKLHENAQLARYLDDPLFRTEINLYIGTAVNVLYIFIKFFAGVVLRSEWLIAFALYYTALTILRASLVNYVRKNEMKHDIRGEYRRYRLVGILLIGLNVVLSGILSRMIGHNEAYDYPGVLIYAMDAYTFYAVILAVVGLFRFRRHGSPILSAIKVVNLTAALVALLSLEAAMLQHFGPDNSSRFRHTMLGVSGLVASLILLSMSVYMIVHASKKLKADGRKQQ